MLKKTEKISSLSKQAVQTMRLLESLESHESFGIAIEGVRTAELTIHQEPDSIESELVKKLVDAFQEYKVGLIRKVIAEARGYKI